MIMTRPATRVSQTTAAERRSAGVAANADPAASAAALVGVTTMSHVLDVRPPPIGPAKLAYRPCTGLTPASTLVAMPLGRPLRAPARPASRSPLRSARWGRTA